MCQNYMLNTRTLSVAFHEGVLILNFFLSINSESESEGFSKSESADFREVRGLGLGCPKSSGKYVHF
jgi:hypothetical protein